MRRDVLQDIREAIDRALAEGRTFDQFREELTPLLKEKGWWGKAQMTDMTVWAQPIDPASDERPVAAVG